MCFKAYVECLVPSFQSTRFGASWAFSWSLDSKAREPIRRSKAGYAEIAVVTMLSLVKKAEARRARGNHRIRSLDNFLAVDVSRDDASYNGSGDYVPALAGSAWPMKFGDGWREIIWRAIGAAHLNV